MALTLLIYTSKFCSDWKVGMKFSITQYRGKCSNGPCSKCSSSNVNCNSGPCSNGPCSNVSYSSESCSNVNCRSGTCSNMNCSNGPCSNVFYSRASCSYVNCGSGPCSNAKCSNEPCSNVSYSSESYSNWYWISLYYYQKSKIFMKGYPSYQKYCEIDVVTISQPGPGVLPDLHIVCQK